MCSWQCVCGAVLVAECSWGWGSGWWGFTQLSWHSSADWKRLFCRGAQHRCARQRRHLPAVPCGIFWQRFSGASPSDTVMSWTLIVELVESLCLRQGPPVTGPCRGAAWAVPFVQGRQPCGPCPRAWYCHRVGGLAASGQGHGAQGISGVVDLSGEGGKQDKARKNFHCIQSTWDPRGRRVLQQSSLVLAETRHPSPLPPSLDMGCRINVCSQ